MENEIEIVGAETKEGNVMSIKQVIVINEDEDYIPFIEESSRKAVEKKVAAKLVKNEKDINVVRNKKNEIVIEMKKQDALEILEKAKKKGESPRCGAPSSQPRSRRGRRFSRRPRT